MTHTKASAVQSSQTGSQKPLVTASTHLDDYRQCYMKQTLRLLEQARETGKGTIRLPAYRDPGCDAFIIVDIDDVEIPDIWASNTFHHTDAADEAIITLSPRLLAQDRTRQKRILAHEWFEVMMAFQNPEQRRAFMTVGKESMAQLFEALRLPPIWQDSAESAGELQQAVSRLLVPDDSLIAYMEAHIGLPIVRRDGDDPMPPVASDPGELRDRIVSQADAIARGFASEHSVDESVVRHRLRALLCQLFIEGNAVGTPCVSSNTDRATEDVLQEIERVGKQFGVPNWDGYGAAPVPEKACRVAGALLRAMPEGTPAPAVGADPDGDLTLEWYRNPHRVLSVSISPHGELHYSAIVDACKAYGTETFMEEVPEVILAQIRRIFGP